MPKPVVSSNSRGLYVHIPFCDGKCAYCAFFSVPYDGNASDRYIRCLSSELTRLRSTYPDFVPDTVYIGGGTPTILSPAQLELLGNSVRRFVAPTGASEWTVEANPGSLTREKLATLVKLGVNRISLGVQALDDQVLRRLGRRHSAAAAREACHLIRAAGLDNLSIDLIAGIPGVTAGQWRETLKRALALQPRHVSVYALTVEEGTRLQVLQGRGQFRAVSDALQLRALHTAETVLKKAGLVRYEISNYAQPGYECRHNVACWRGQEYLGIGVAAASRLGDRRWTNNNDCDAYFCAVDRGEPPPSQRERLTPKLAATEDLIFGLRQRAGVCLERIIVRRGLDEESARQHWLRQLRVLCRRGLVRRIHGNWRLTGRGFDLADAVAVELMD